MSVNSKDAQKQIADKIKDVDNFLVTVNANPTVDELSAALGITLVLNDMGKHATAVFSGDIPPAITFLDPQKTFENTVDSLRDFIIALDKEKADHLRYKVDGDMVKIFITPYKTTISDKDLEFSQGDYNVEMVLAIGVKSEDDLDHALADHGRILHDATVASLSLEAGSAELGTINWQDTSVSSYSEMLVGLIDQIKGSKNPINEQVATAFLTGIVAATERFSNTQTTANTMTVAAQLMAAGANQQLIATKLEEAEEISTDTPEVSDTKDVPENKSEKIDKKAEPVKDKQAADGTMSISHEPKGSVDEVAEQVIEEKQERATEAAEEKLAEGLANTTPAVPTLIDDDIKTDSASMSLPDVTLPAPITEESIPTATLPTLGGTLNATTEQTAAEKLIDQNDTKNRTILSHETSDYVEGGQPSLGSPVNSFSETHDTPEPTDTAKLSEDAANMAYSQHAMKIDPIAHATAPTLADLDAQNHAHGAGAIPPMPPMPDFSTLPQLPGSEGGFIPSPLPAQPAVAPAADPLTSPALDQITPNPDPVQPSSNDMTMGPLPSLATPASAAPAEQEQSLSDRLGDILPPARPDAIQPSVPNDPSQFQIPGQ